MQGIGTVRLRWIGHRLRAECEVLVDGGLGVAQGHHIAEQAQHRLLHAVPGLATVLVHADPVTGDGTNPHELTAHHMVDPMVDPDRPTRVTRRPARG